MLSSESRTKSDIEATGFQSTVKTQIPSVMCLHSKLEIRVIRMRVRNVLNGTVAVFLGRRFQSWHPKLNLILCYMAAFAALTYMYVRWSM